MNTTAYTEKLENATQQALATIQAQRAVLIALENLYAELSAQQNALVLAQVAGE